MHSKTDDFYNNLKLGYMKKGNREINTEQQGKSKLGRNIKMWFPCMKKMQGNHKKPECTNGARCTM